MSQEKTANEAETKSGVHAHDDSSSQVPEFAEHDARNPRLRRRIYIAIMGEYKRLLSEDPDSFSKELQEILNKYLEYYIPDDEPSQYHEHKEPSYNDTIFEMDILRCLNAICAPGGCVPPLKSVLQELALFSLRYLLPPTGRFELIPGIGERSPDYTMPTDYVSDSDLLTIPDTEFEGRIKYMQKQWQYLSNHFRDILGFPISPTLYDSRRNRDDLTDEEQFSVEYALHRVHLIDGFYVRWTKGMAREHQVELLQKVYGEMLNNMQFIVNEGLPNEDLWEALETSRRLIEFFTDYRFRSERLELLLLKYLYEGEINRAVVQGIDRATRRLRQARNASRIKLYLYLRSLGIKEDDFISWREDPEALKLLEEMNDPFGGMAHTMQCVSRMPEIVYSSTY